ncbi:hypothetical protein DB35_08255 [Streptomyces abyssalis]|uniref:Uncharacterized protein n=1 Tax=Streptomyces abyssalis TaxID=933944 RepID=A0A1E7JSB1_9ACTN|nr:hypothetical protein AN215_04535 [Streptomyces abyssalis]OEU94090.1 hypothetical protein DB35_08255 [Streptomyces abyssalis]
MIAAPPGGEFADWGWWVIGAFGVLFVLSIFFSFLDGWKMRKHTFEEQAEVFLTDLRTGAVTVRGHIRLNPVKYTKLTAKDADRIAEEAGYHRQTFGTKGQWLFFRPSDPGEEPK